MKIVIAGASGFIGKHLIAGLVGNEIVALQRSSKALLGAVTSLWDAETPESCQAALENADVVINLVGAPISVKWNDENRKEILESRLKSTRAIGIAIQRCAVPPKLWINASAVGFYGDRGDEELTEESAPGSGFLADVCKAWEEAAMELDLTHTRRVQIRTGFVLGNDGGALPTLAKLSRLLLGGAAGNGKQWVPWIHVDDLVGIFHLAIDKDVQGPINGCAPQAVRNGEMMHAIRSAVNRPWSPPVPSIMLSLAGKLTGPAPELVMNSSKVVPKKATELGFSWKFESIESALRNLL